MSVSSIATPAGALTAMSHALDAQLETLDRQPSCVSRGMALRLHLLGTERKHQLFENRIR